jgi:hypothetical protein
MFNVLSHQIFAVVWLVLSAKIWGGKKKQRKHGNALEDLGH